MGVLGGSHIYSKCSHCYASRHSVCCCVMVRKVCHVRKMALPSLSLSISLLCRCVHYTSYSICTWKNNSRELVSHKAITIQAFCDCTRHSPGIRVLLLPPPINNVKNDVKGVRLFCLTSNLCVEVRHLKVCFCFGDSANGQQKVTHVFV